MNKRMLKFFLAIITIVLCLSLTACVKVAMPIGDYDLIYNREMPTMQLSDDGTIKVLQISDLHLVGGKNKDDKKTLEALDKTLKNNKYDIVIITGDLFEGFTNRSYDKPSAVNNIKEIFDNNNQAFTLVMGNNDGEYLGTPENIICELVKSPNFVYADAKDVGGIGNFYIKLVDKNGAEKHRLVMLDTRMRDSKGIYLHMDESQTNYYNDIANECKEKNIKLSVFTHIPFNLEEVIKKGKSLESDLNVCDITNFYANTNNSEPMFKAIVESDVCGLIASGHMHTVDVAKEVGSIYFKITRTAGYYSNLPKEVKHGGSAITLNCNGQSNSEIYNFENINFDN